MTSIIIIITVVVLLVLWVIGVQRKLVGAEELCKNSLSQIGVQQSSRWDALSALCEQVASYDEHEANTLKEVISARAAITAGSTAAEADAQENLISSALKTVFAVAEQYPQLKASELYVKSMDSVNLYENQVRTSRMVYNDSVTKFNRIIRQLPDSLIAAMLGFKALDYLKEDQNKSSMPSMKIGK